MSIGDCIQINENQFYTNSNIVLHYNNINNCNKDLRTGNNLFHGANSCQTFQNIDYDDNQNQSDFSFNLISHPSKKLAEVTEFPTNPTKESFANTTDNSRSPSEDPPNAANYKSSQKEQSKSVVIKTPDNKSLNSRLNDKMSNGLFNSNSESSGPIAKKCKVCFDKAVNQNFGVLSCESCKAFFRRNAIRSSPLKCSNGTDLCSITSSTRKQCPSCRLKKCLQVGMKSELIQIRKNNPKINLGKRKSKTTSQDGIPAKWANQSTNCSISSGRLSQENLDDHQKPPTDIGLVSNMLADNSPLISTGLWINTSNYQYQLNNPQNLWLPMNLDQQCNDSLNCNLLSTNCIAAPITNQSYSQSFDPIKYDVQIPMIKIKTHHNIVQPIAILPTTSTSIYETQTETPSIYSNELKSNPTKFLKDPLLASEMLRYSDISMQSIYQYDLSNYSITSNTPKPSIGSNSSPSAFYPFTMQPVVASSQSVYFNAVETTNINSYLWECPNKNSESSISNDHSNSFMSIDSGSEAFFGNPTYPDSCNSSQKIYLSPDRFEILESNPSFSGMEGEENKDYENYPEFSLSDDFPKSLQHSENSLLSDNILISDEQHFIIEIGQIWESTLSRDVIFPNPNNVKVHLDLNATPKSVDGFESFTNFSSTNNWKITFFQLSDIFLRQIKLFFEKIIDILSWNHDLGNSLKSELTDIMANQSNETLLLIVIPIIFSNLITKFPIIDNDQFLLDKETHQFLFSDQKTNHVYSESLDSPTVYFSVTCRDPTDNAINLVNAHINLTVLSNRFFELDNIKYSSLQYLDKYCSGLSNFLSPTPVFYGLFALLKLISTRTKDDYCDLSWNAALLRRESSPVTLNGTVLKLIYDLKSIFVTACDIVQTDTVEQRINSLDQFLSWSKSQFDLQWIDFFSNIKQQQQQHQQQQSKTNDYPFT